MKDFADQRICNRIELGPSIGFGACVASGVMAAWIIYRIAIAIGQFIARFL
jgi:hypothetical protein